MKLLVLHVDNHLLAVAKPAGLPVVPDASGDPSLLDLARGWVEEEFAKPGKAFLGVVHRIDRPVSGVVLFARTSKAARRLSAAFAERRVEKRYLGVVVRAPARAAGTVEQWLRKDRKRNRVTAQEHQSAAARLARTHWRLLAEDERTGHALLELVPETGRPHQIRVALATLGSPLVGDLKYGAPVPLPNACIALHAVALGVPHPTRDEDVRMTCDPPPEAIWTAFGGRASQRPDSVGPVEPAGT